MSHVCGFAIAAQRRARELHTAKQYWLGDVQSAYQRARHAGFTGTFEEWQTAENLTALIKRRGRCPFTRRDLIKHGWKLARPYGKPGRRAMWMLVAAHGGKIAQGVDYWFPNLKEPITTEAALKACNRAKITEAHVAGIVANVAADPEHYSRTEERPQHPGSVLKRAMLVNSLPAYDRPPEEIQ